MRKIEEHIIHAYKINKFDFFNYTYFSNQKQSIPDSNYLKMPVHSQD